jgi:hypothetical protein
MYEEYRNLQEYAKYRNLQEHVEFHLHRDLKFRLRELKVLNANWECFQHYG